MSLFSRLAKNLKRGLRKLAPIAATFIPGIGGVIAGALSPFLQSSGQTPGIVPDIARPPLPGAGRVPSRAARFPPRRDPSQALRKRPLGGRNVIQPGPQVQQMSIFAALPALAGPARAAAGGIFGRIARSPIVRGLAAGAAGSALVSGLSGADGACPSGWHLNKQDGVGGAAGTYCVRNRRMNFGNARSARRSVRRLKGARKLLRDIEKMMPTRTVRARHGPASPPHAPR